MIPPAARGRDIPSGNIRLTNQPDAVPVILTRDPSRAEGVFIREELADGIFDEINNVIEANRALAKGQKRFMFDTNIYYRIYAERQHVDQDPAQAALLLNAGVTDLYAPSLFWFGQTSNADVAAAYSELFLRPRSPQIHALLRVAVLLGNEFCLWLLGRWKSKWAKHPQPPTFFFTFQQMCSEMSAVDYRSIAARLAPSKLIQCMDEQSVSVSELLQNEAAASALLSKSCMHVFQGRGEERSIARDLDYIAYGRSVRERSVGLADAIISTVGGREPGDFANAATA
jgi:hypothetical protein